MVPRPSPLSTSPLRNFTVFQASLETVSSKFLDEVEIRFCAFVKEAGW